MCNTIYLIYSLCLIKPELLRFIFETLMQKLERLQNQALRPVTGAVKTTQIDSMLLLTGINL